MHHIGFVGSWRVSHPRRKNFINRLQADKIPFDHRKLSRIGSAEHYAKSLMAFNCSLNGDLNMRVHEILSAGGFLLTDKLAAQSGLDDMLVDGEEYVSYASYRELREKARYFIQHPQEALEIARKGLARYHLSCRPTSIAQHFLAWAIHGECTEHDYLDELSVVKDVSMAVRLRLYEFAQNKQLWQESTPVLLVGERSSQLCNDLDGLVRVRSYVLQREAAVILHDPSTVSLDRARETKWSIVVADVSEESVAQSLNVAEGGLFIV